MILLNESHSRTVASWAKEVLLYIVATVVLGTSLLNYFSEKEANTHPASTELTSALVKFMEHGDRNTAMDGYDLCTRVVRIETVLFPNEKPTNCKERYYRFRAQESTKKQRGLTIRKSAE